MDLHNNKQFWQHNVIRGLLSPIQAAAKRLMRIYKGDMLAYEKDGKRVIGSVKQLSLQAGLILAPHTETNADSRNRNKADPFKFTYLGAGSLIKTKARRIHIDEIGRLRNSGPPA